MIGDAGKSARRWWPMLSMAAFMTPWQLSRLADYIPCCPKYPTLWQKTSPLSPASSSHELTSLSSVISNKACDIGAFWSHAHKQPMHLWGKKKREREDATQDSSDNTKPGDYVFSLVFRQKVFHQRRWGSFLMKLWHRQPWMRPWSKPRSALRESLTTQPDPTPQNLVSSVKGGVDKSPPLQPRPTREKRPLCWCAD